MPSTDPIGDMIAVIKNANTRRHRRVEVPHSRLKESVATVLKDEGYLEDVRTVGDDKRTYRRTLHVFLKFDTDGEPVITDIKRVSKPGNRVFRGVREIPKVLDGLGVTVLSTPKGVMSDRRARRERVGGELLCKVW